MRQAHSKKLHQPGRTGGFTLMELLVTVLIGSILVAMAYPSFSKMIRRNQVDTTAQQLNSTLTYARTEAIRRNACVSVCGVDNESGVKCSNVNPTDWAKGGWITYVNARCDLSQVEVASSEILKRSPPKPELHVYVSTGQTDTTNLGASTFYTFAPFQSKMVMFNSIGNAFNHKLVGTLDTNPTNIFFTITPDSLVTLDTKLDKRLCLAMNGKVEIRDFTTYCEI